VKVNVSAGQWVGIALVVLTGAVMAVALPRYADGTTPSNGQVKEVAEGTRVSEGAVSIVPSDGWSQSTEVPGILILKNEDASFLINVPEKATGDSMSDVVSSMAKAMSGGDGVQVEIGDPSTFTTTSGLDGAKLVVGSPDGVTLVAAVTDGKRSVLATLNVNNNAWQGLRGDTGPMLESIQIDASAAPAPSEDR
jgi:hypothetical protein